MYKEINLEATSGRLTNCEPFIMAENEELTLKFSSSYDIGELYLRIVNGATVVTLKIFGDTVTVPQTLYFAGVLEVFVTLIVRGESVKRWMVEPIIIKELDCGISGLPALCEIEQKLQNMSQEELAYREQLLLAVEKQFTVQAQRIQALEKTLDTILNNPLGI